MRIVDKRPAVLFYPMDQVPVGYVDFESKVIAMCDLVSWQAQRQTHTFYTRHGELTIDSHLIEYRKATDADIASIGSAWRPSFKYKWVKSLVANEHILMEAEKVRVFNILLVS
jgi:hypothetical protein